MEKIKEKMRISASSSGLRNFSLQKMISIVKKIGFDYLEGTTDARAHLYPYIFGNKNLEELKNILSQNKIELVAVSGGWSDFAIADKYLNRQYDSLGKQIDFCWKFNVKILRIFASNLPGQYIEKSIIERVIRNIKRIMPKAKEKNVYLAIENHYGVTAKADDLLRIIEGVGHPNLKVNLDAANFLPMQEDPVKACKKLLPYIAHLHLKDARRTKEKNDFENAYLTGRNIWQGYEYCDLGKGLMDYPKISDMLLENNYNGFFSIEYEDFSNPIEGMRNSYKNLKKILSNF